MKKSFKYIALLSLMCAILVSCLIVNHEIDAAETVQSNWYWTKYFFGYTGLFFCLFFAPSSFIAAMVTKEEVPAVQNQADAKDGDIFYFYGDYHYGYSRVEELHVISVAEKQVKSRFAFANEEGEIVTKWFEGATEFEKPGVAVVYDDGRYNFLDKECNLILTSWPKNIGEQINDNKLKVFWDDGTINFVDFKKKGLLWKDWKKSIG